MAPGKSKPAFKPKKAGASAKGKKSARPASRRQSASAESNNGNDFRLVEPVLQATSLLAAIVDSSDDAIISKTLDGIITSWNKSAERIFGYAAKEAIGKPITLIIPKDRLEEEKHIIRQLKRGKRVDHFETVRARKDGSLLNVSVTISPVKDADGRVVGASKVARDITFRKDGEKALADRMRRQRALYNLADQLHRAKSKEDIYAAGLDAILGALHCHRASILLFDESGVIRFVSWRGLSTNYRKATDGHSPWKLSDENPSVICVEDIQKAELPESLRSTIRGEGIGALAFIPLIAGGQLIGKFMSYFNEPHLPRTRLN
jgi:PAS domain S-box-containing protein